MPRISSHFSLSLSLSLARSLLPSGARTPVIAIACPPPPKTDDSGLPEGPRLRVWDARDGGGGAGGRGMSSTVFAERQISARKAWIGYRVSIVRRTTRADIYRKYARARI